MKIPEQLYNVKPNLVFCLFAPVFALLFVVIYTPTFGLNPEFYVLVDSNKGFCIPILCSIELGVLLASRAILCFAIVRHRLSEMEFLLWQAIEYVVACLFFDLFLSLYLHLGYFDLLPIILLVSLGINIFPYAFYWVFMERVDRDQRIAEAYKLMNNLRRPADGAEGMVRFADDKGNVRLVVGADKVISVQSAGNYLTITYDDGGKPMRKALHRQRHGPLPPFFLCQYQYGQGHPPYPGGHGGRNRPPGGIQRAGVEDLRLRPHQPFQRELRMVIGYCLSVIEYEYETRQLFGF